MATCQRQPMKRTTFLLFLFIFPSHAFAFEWTMHGAIKNETAYFISGETRLDKLQNRLDVKPEFTLTDRLEFRGRALLWYDAAMDIEPNNTTDLTPSIKDHYRSYTQSKEAYFLYAANDFDLRVGQQQIVWGKTDSLRLLDIINPLDMREFLLDDFLDSRIGVVAARLNYYTYWGNREHEFEFVIVPDVKPTEFAPFGSRWAFALPSFPVGTTPVILQGDKPSWSTKNPEYGAAWRANMADWDLSLNWFHGWQDTPNIQKQLSGSNLFLTPVYSRIHTLGGSLSNVFGALVFRGELAANVNEALNASGVTPTSSITNKTTLNLAVAMDYTANHWTFSSQFFFRHIAAWRDDILEDRNSGFVSLRIATDFMNEKLKPEVTGLFSWSDQSWMLRPKVSYEWSDQIIAALGIDLFAGGNTSFFGQFSNNDRIYTELEYSF